MTQNISRLRHLLSMYRMTEEELYTLASKGLKTALTHDDLFREEIEMNHLKRIDKIFNKGLFYYIDPTEPIKDESASIFFRKSHFDTDLNFGARQRVNEFEKLKTTLSGMAKMAGIDTVRHFPVYNFSHNAKRVAADVSKSLYPEFVINKREFLKALITQLSEYDIMVMEFVDTWNKTDKANIDGFFLQPNLIVLKRQQNAFRREIFTLAHELGHYLLNAEEVEEVDFTSHVTRPLSTTERWCNDFAFSFLAGHHETTLDNLTYADATNDYHLGLVKDISDKTHLSRLAIYTHLLYQNKLSNNTYSNIKADFDAEYKRRQEEIERKKELDKQRGIQSGGRSPRPIESPLLISTLQTAYYEGVINEYDFCKTLNIKPDKINLYLE